MTAPSLLDELEQIVNLMNDPTKYSDQIGQAAVEFLDIHHAEIAELSKLEARITEAPVATLSHGNGELLVAVSAEDPADWAGKTVRLLVDDDDES